MATNPDRRRHGNAGADGHALGGSSDQAPPMMPPDAVSTVHTHRVTGVVRGASWSRTSDLTLIRVRSNQLSLAPCGRQR